MALRAQWARTKIRSLEGRRSTAATVAGLVFVGAVVVALPLYLIRGSDQWFFLDEWDFLAARSLTNFDSLFRPHNEHWSTLPIVVYRVLWQGFGLRTYVPYQAVLVVLHLTAAVLLRRIMRRADVDPWVATAAALLFLFLGSGRQNIVWAFQIGFVGSLVFGLAHLILADHDGPPDRRDAIGIAFGFAGLLCSGIGVTMTIIVGLAVLIRRGWRAAALHTVPLALCFGAWYFAAGRSGYRNGHGSLSGVWEFVTTGLENAFARMGQVRGVGVLLAVVLVVGLCMAWIPMSFDTFRRRAAAPAALLIGAVLFLSIAGYGRTVGAFGAEFARQSRYVHLVTAMSIVAMAVAADALVRRWRILLPVVVALFLIGIPGNIDAITPKGLERFTRGNEARMLALAHSPLARRVPRAVRPDPAIAAEVTVGWLLDGARSGRIPRPASGSRQDAIDASLLLLVQQTHRHGATRACAAVERQVTVRVRPGDRLVFRGGLPIGQLRLADGSLSLPRIYQPGFGSTLLIRGEPATLVVTKPPLAPRLVMCRSS